MTARRPRVSVIVPFRGDCEAAAAAIDRLSRLETREGDELRVADNSDGGSFARIAPDGLLTLRATRERSSYHARNAGAHGAHGDWLLFLDADCVPDPDLIDAYFADPVPANCGVLAGRIAADESQSSMIARYARARNFISKGEGLQDHPGQAPATGNLLVRRAAFEGVGGFAEGIRSGGDVDLCLRIRDAGWTLQNRLDARVVHPHRETLGGLLRQIARYAAGARWLEARHPGTSLRWPLGEGLVASARMIGSNLASGSFEEATFRAIDALGLVAHNIGYLVPNRAPRGV
jgi:glycosyltransferase involved in cell wall biosynthesis